MLTGIIGGTGFENLSCVQYIEERRLNTDYGEPSSALRFARWNHQDTKASEPVVFLSRHGFEHSIPPHLINYRANIEALRQVGAKSVIAIYAVGGIDPQMLELGHIVIPDQLIDYSFGRNPSFWDAQHPEMLHVDMTEPYSPLLRGQLLSSAKKAGLSVSTEATYACTNGPRLETAAEIRRLANEGNHIVGMTGMPEAALAREAGLEFAALCVVVNPAAGLAVGPIDHSMIQAAVQVGEKKVFAILDHFFADCSTLPDSQ